MSAVPSQREPRTFVAELEEAADRLTEGSVPDLDPELADAFAGMLNLEATTARWHAGTVSPSALKAARRIDELVGGAR